MSANKDNNGNGPADEQDEKYDVEVTDDEITVTPKDANDGIRDTVEFHAVADVFEGQSGWDEGDRFKGVYHEGGYAIWKGFKTADEAEAWVEAAIRGPKSPRLELRLTWADSKTVGRLYWPALIVDNLIVRSAELHNRDAALAWIASVGDEFGVEYQDVPLPPED